MSRLCLDTSAYSHFRRGEVQLVAHIDRAEWIGVPSVVLGELWAGFLSGTRADENEAELVEFLAHPIVEVLPLDASVARIYGEIFTDLRAHGRQLPTNDLWVAAAAVRAGAIVLTFDAHFQDVTRAGALILTAAPP